jgi:glycerophosphoryl diester phosphodiesterase
LGIINIAHRGYSGKFDENTMLAFKKAIEYKADGIETDVQLSKDGVPVIIHDETLDRTTNGHGFVKDYTLDELKTFRTKSVPRVQALKTDALEEIEYLKSNILKESEDIESGQSEKLQSINYAMLEKVNYLKELSMDRLQDSKLKRSNGDNKGNFKIGEYTIKEVEHFQNKIGEEIPTLREVLELVAHSDLKVLNLELKNSVIEYKGLEEKVLTMIDEFNLRDRIIISSFNHMSLVEIRKIEGQKNKINKNLLTDKRIILGALTDSTLVNVPKYLKAISVECYHPYFSSILNKAYMKEIKNTGIKVNPYTVNNVEDMKSVIELGVDSIITNEVELLNTLL